MLNYSKIQGNDQHFGSFFEFLLIKRNWKQIIELEGFLVSSVQPNKNESIWITDK